MTNLTVTSVGLDYLIMKMGNYNSDLIATFIADIKKAKELEAEALVDAYEMGMYEQMYEQDRASNLVDTEAYMMPEWF